MSATVWRATRSDYALAQWDEQVVVFHRPSGLTHFINASTSQLLADLSASPCDTDSLVDRFVADPNTQASPDVRDQILTLLFRLEELGLIERVAAANAA